MREKIRMDHIGDLALHVKISGILRWSLRVWVMMRCLHLAAWIAPANVHIQIEEPPEKVSLNLYAGRIENKGGLSSTPTHVHHHRKHRS